MKNKKIKIIILLLIIIFFIIFTIFKVKNTIIGNNNINQENESFLLNFNSYQAEIEVEIISNKNQNNYKIKQEYNEPNELTQEIVEPEEIAGVKITKKDGKLILENSKLKLSKIYENYQTITENDLDLKTFVEEFEQKGIKKEEGDEIIFETINKKLYLNKENYRIEKMDVINKNQKIYIKYNELEIK